MRAIRCLCVYAGAAVLIAATPWGLSAFQDWLSQMEDRPVRAFAVAYLPPLALLLAAHELTSTSRGSTSASSASRRGGTWGG